MEESLFTYSEAAALLMERFPLLGLQAASWAETKMEEKELQIEVGKADVVYFYGLCPSIFFQCKAWLAHNKDRHLIFLEDDLGVIASFLHRREAIEILSHLQVHIALPSEIDALAEQFPVRRLEVFGHPSKKKLKTLKLKILRKTTLTHALHLDRLHGYQPFQNFIQNAKQIPRSFYANHLRNALKNIPAIVCGAGPSLEPTLGLLREMETRAVIIAGGSTLAALSSHGINPHFGMAVDPNLEEYRRLKNSFAFEVPLLYSTRVFPAIFQTCNGPFGYMRSGIGGLPELWLEEELGLLDPLLGDFLSEESISVTAICVAWAQFIGCNPILLNGVDMAYTGKKRYAAGVVEEEELIFQAIDAEKSAPDRIIRRKNRKGQFVHTAVRWVMESASISHFAKKHPEVHFINTTPDGIGFQDIEYVPLEDAAKHFPTLDIRTRIHEGIDKARMKKGTQEKLEEKIGDLKASLERVIEFLQILSGERSGSKALAELELQEEIATLYLFYDARQLFTSDLWGGVAKISQTV